MNKSNVRKAAGKAAADPPAAVDATPAVVRDKPPNRKARKPGPDWPQKPYDGFPLGPAVSGCWQKKINGKIFYFGRWGKIINGRMVRLPDDGWQAALALFQAQRDDLYAGRTQSAQDGRWAEAR